MTRRRWIIFLVVFIVAVGAFMALMFSEPAEPRFKSRSLSEWVEDISPTSLTPGPGIRTTAGSPVIFVRRGNLLFVTGAAPTNLPVLVSAASGPTLQYPPQHLAAAEAIRQIGTNAIPHLVRTAYLRDGKLKAKLLALWRKQNAIKPPFKSAMEQQQHALPALGELGAAAVWTWVEMLTNDLATPAVQRYAAARLAQMRHEATPALPALLLAQNHPDPTARVSIGHAIQYCDRLGLLSALHNLRWATNRDIRASAAWSLGFIGTHSDMCLPALATALEDQSPHVRESAVDALGKFGLDALPLVNRIQRATQDPERRVRKAASNALERIVEGRAPRA